MFLKKSEQEQVFDALTKRIRKSCTRHWRIMTGFHCVMCYHLPDNTYYAIETWEQWQRLDQKVER